ncbi:MAG TPA: DUF29 domain-containing protein [Afifellaceae bacterium]|nr:DUF29 domain-containing protein [Afifellaceae bacterium]
MGNHSLYDEDILLWSEQQAAALRRLGEKRRDLPNELDLENVAEEIESVGRSELAAVKSQIRLILAHLIKMLLEPESEAVRHWDGEIVSFHTEFLDRYAPSMRQRIDMDYLWRRSREQALRSYRGTPVQQAVTELRDGSPIELDDLLAERLDSAALVERLRQMAAAEQG